MTVYRIVNGENIIRVTSREVTNVIKVSTRPAQNVKIINNGRGIPGIQGDAASIEVGSTTTLDPGSSATVTNVGTEQEAVFNFGIPRGEDGEASNLVTSVNGQQGIVVLDSSDVGADSLGSATQSLVDANEYTDEVVGDIDTGVMSIVAGTNVSVNNTDPANPIINVVGGGSVDSVNGQTGVVVLDTDDIDDTATNRYTNDSDISRLANTSGTNTGDQDLSTYATTTALTSGLATKEPTIAAGTTLQYWRGDKSWQTLDKASVGLSNVDNTSDMNKPISSATQTALDAKQPLDADLTALAVAGNSSVLSATTASFTTADETKLDGIQAGAEVNVNADWNAVSGDAQILNKPTIPTGNVTAASDFGNDNRLIRSDGTGKGVQPSGIVLNDSDIFTTTLNVHPSGESTPSLYRPNDGLIIRGSGSGQWAQLRITYNTGGWTDGVVTSYFQIKNSNATTSLSRNLVFMAGTSGDDGNFNRLQFPSESTQVINTFFTSTPVPTGVFEVINDTAGTLVQKIRGATSQTANLTEWQNGSGTPLSWIDADGNYCTKSPDGTSYRLIIEDGGVLTTEEI